MTSDREQYLYRMRDAAGRLLYVGVTWNPKTRFAQHRRESRLWFAAVATIELTEYATRGAALAAERRAINDERPAMNVVDSAVRAEWAATGLSLHTIGVEEGVWVTALRVAHACDDSLNDFIRRALNQYIAENEHAVTGCEGDSTPPVILARPAPTAETAA